jgi:transposase
MVKKGRMQVAPTNHLTDKISIPLSKFVDHLPFYRQIEMFRRQFDLELHKATLNDWFCACCTLLQPLYERHSKQVLETDYPARVVVAF